MKKSISRLIFIVLSSCLLPNMLFAGKTGTITGLVVDDTTGIGMSWVTVAVKQANIAANTDINGIFNLYSVPEGTDTLTVSFLGYQTQKVVVVIKGGESKRVTITLKPEVILGSEVIIYGQAKGQVKANEEQFESPMIVNVVSGAKMQEFPDANAAEAIGRLPGISLTRTNGEADKLVIRGLSSQWNYVTLEGFQMPSTNFTDRSVDMSLLPSDIFSGVEVFKALRADLDANALGGTVNMRLPKAAQIQKIDLGVEGGYAFLNSSFANYIFRIGYSNRFFNKRLGVNIKASREQKDRPQQSFTGNYSGITHWTNPSGGTYYKQYSTSFTLDDIQLHTTRSNADVILDYGNNWWDVKLFSLFAQKLDRETQRSNAFLWGQGADGDNIDMTMYSQEWITNNLMNTFQNEFRFLNTKLDLALNLSIVNQRFNENYFPFEEVDYVNIDKNSTVWADPATLYNSPGYATVRQGHPKASILKELHYDGQKLVDRNYGANLDYEIPYKITDFIDGKIKLGGKTYHLTRSNGENNDFLSFQYGGNPPNRKAMLTDFGIPSNNSAGLGVNGSYLLDNSYNPGKFITGTYHIPYSFNIGELTYIQNQVVYNPKEKLHYYVSWTNQYQNTYSSYEYQTAGYLLTELTLGKNLTIVPGLRYEKNNTSSTGYVIMTSSNLVGYTGNPYTVTYNRSLGDFFPSVNLKYHASKTFNVWADFYRSTTRPNFTDYSPTQIYPNPESGGFPAYNPFLTDALAWNYDLSFSYFDKTNSVGLISASGFYKEVQGLEVYMGNYPISLLQNPVIGAPSNFTSLFPPTNYFLPAYVLNGAYAWSMPLNNPEKAYIKGIELSWQTNLSYLPGLLKGIVFEINYTLINSITRYPLLNLVQINADSSVYHYATRSGELVNQPAYKINANIGWDYKGFSIRASYSYQAKTLSSLDSRYSVNDSYVAPVTLADLMITQKINHRFTFKLNLTNILKQVDNSYTSSFKQVVSGTTPTTEPALPQTSQYYGIRGQIGISYNL